VPDPSSRIRKLKWLCRRGMKELDVLLERFIEANCTQLEKGHFPEMESMLQVEDDVLWDWLQQPDLAVAEPYRKLLKQILHG
jgi:antitoxin CptB